MLIEGVYLHSKFYSPSSNGRDAAILRSQNPHRTRKEMKNPKLKTSRKRLLNQQMGLTAIPWQLLSAWASCTELFLPAFPAPSALRTGQLFSQMCTAGGELPLAQGWATDSAASEPFSQDKGPRDLPLAGCLFWALIRRYSNKIVRSHFTIFK